MIKFDYKKFIIYTFIIVGFLLGYHSINVKTKVLEAELKAQHIENIDTRAWLGELDTKVNQLFQQFDNKKQICN